MFALPHFGCAAFLHLNLGTCDRFYAVQLWFGFFDLPRLAPSQTPQSARREDEGEAPEPAERPECPDEEEAARKLGDLAVMCPPHVHDGHGCREQSDEQHDDVPRSPFGEHQRPVQQHHENGQRNV